MRFGTHARFSVLFLVGVLAACRQYPTELTYPVAELIAEYEVGGDAADIRFAKRPLRVIGIVSTVGTSPKGRRLVRFEIPHGSAFTVLAVMADDQQNALAAGDRAFLNCRSLNRRINLILTGCRLA